VLEVEDLTTKYGSISALRSVSLTVRSGEVVGLVGPNGAGKTTLVNSIAGLLTPSSGRITVDGTDVTTTGPDAMLRAGVALVPERRRLFADLTVADNLKIGATTVPKSDRAALMDEMALLFPILGEKWHVSAGYLSGGQAQQLAIARALMSRPRLLMMDEPSLGLAPVLVDVVFDLIVQLREQGVTLLVVEQNANRMLTICDRAYVLRSGQLAATGTGEALIADGALFDLFVGRQA
jgi:branched-chain amino acid transport system ATP-binding protein